MNIDVQVNSTGLILKASGAFQKNLLGELNKQFILSGQFLLAEVQKATPVGASAELRRGWFMDVKMISTEGGEVAQVTISNPSEYLEPTELGRKASPVSLEGQKSMALWVTRKLGITDPKKVKSVVFLICRKKKVTATKGQFFMRATVEKCIPVVIANLQNKFQGMIDNVNINTGD